MDRLARQNTREQNIEGNNGGHPQRLIQNPLQQFEDAAWHTVKKDFIVRAGALTTINMMLLSLFSNDAKFVALGILSLMLMLHRTYGLVTTLDNTPRGRPHQD